MPGIPPGTLRSSAAVCNALLGAVGFSYTEFLGFLLFAAVVSFEAFVLGVTDRTAEIPCTVFVKCEMHSLRESAVVRDHPNACPLPLAVSVRFCRYSHNSDRAKSIFGFVKFSDAYICSFAKNGNESVIV